MTLKRFVRAFSLTGVALLVLAANSSAASITYNTEATTGFGGTSLTLNSSSGAAGSLVFDTVPNTDITTPSQINYGYFTLTCTDCETDGSVFDPFTFNMVITDVGTGATGTFVGTSSGGTILANSSNMTINWAPTQIGPGTLNATVGSDFGFTRYTNEMVTNIVAPNSGIPPGLTTVQGFVDTEAAIPEPATLSLIGIGLLGLGFIHRRRTARS
jgi:hypothetical protein